ncbi:MAG: hypothetical protein IKV34_01525 [Clostridia bacterium]|nr:hypothetical protein [Clostridia bacterium]
MKKKVKLITTIASLCLAVALMAFGVYAALNVSYTIKNTVSYSAAANVKATITYTTELGNATATVPGEGEGAPAVAYTPVTDKVIFADTIGDNSGTNAAAEGEEKIGDLTLTAIDLSQNMTFKYTVTIKNNALASDAYKTLVVDLTLKDTVDKMATEGYSLTVVGEDGEVALNGQMQFSVLITVSPSTSIDKVDLGSVIALEMAA